MKRILLIIFLLPLAIFAQTYGGGTGNLDGDDGDASSLQGIDTNDLRVRWNESIDSNISSNTIIVNSVTDFGTPIAGVITLEDGKTYSLNQQIICPYTLHTPIGATVSIKSEPVGSAVLVYVASDTLFTGSDFGILSLYRLTIVHAAGGVSFSFRNTSDEAFFFARDIQMINPTKLGYIKRGTFAIQTAFAQGFADGFEADSVDDLSLTSVRFQGTGTGTKKYIEINDSLGNSDIHLCTFLTPPGDTIFDIEQGIDIGSINVSSCVFPAGGGLFAANSQDQSSIEVVFGSNTRAPESTVTSEVIIGTNTLTTDMPAVEIPVMLNVNTVTSKVNERISVDALAVATYFGLENVTLSMHCAISMDVAVGNDKKLTGYVGNIHAHDSSVCTFTNATNIVNSTAHILSDGDQVSFYDTDGTLPAELRGDVFYYVVNSATNTFQLSYTLGGSVVSFTDDGIGSNDYSECLINGIPVEITVNANDPNSATPFGLIEVETGDKLCMLISRLDAGDIRVKSGGMIIKL